VYGLDRNFKDQRIQNNRLSMALEYVQRQCDLGTIIFKEFNEYRVRSFTLK